MRDGKILIFTALALEADAIAPAIARARSATLHVIGLRGRKLPDLQTDGPVETIILAGLAGALDPDLRCGDVLVDEPMHCSDRLITTAARKSSLFRATGARAVEMEGDAVRALAATLGVPLIHLRAIVDEAQDELDARLVQMMDSSGAVPMSRVTTMLLRNPSMLRPLLKLRRKTNIALRALAGAVEQVLASLQQVRS